MNSPEIKAYIKEHAELFWYTPQDKKEEVSEELLVEMILNYGTLNDVKELAKRMGLQTIAQVFLGLEGRKKLNYFPEIYNFFYLYFTRHAQRDS